MAHAMANVNGYVSRKDLFYVDPKSIVVVEGFNPRKNFDENHIESLMESIIEIGITNPLQVRKSKEQTLELISGECRLRATLRAIEKGHDIKSVPVILVPQNTNEADLFALAINCNSGQSLSPVDEANGYKRLVSWGWKVEKIAKMVNKSVPYIYKRLELCAASPELEKAINNKEITITEAQTIINKTDGKIEDQKEEIKKVKEKKEDKKFEKEAIKEKVYSGKIMNYIEYKKDVIRLSKELTKAFSIDKTGDMNFAAIEEISVEFMALLDEIKSNC